MNKEYPKCHVIKKQCHVHSTRRLWNNHFPTTCQPKRDHICAAWWKFAKILENNSVKPLFSAFSLAQDVQPMDGWTLRKHPSHSLPSKRVSLSIHNDICHLNLHFILHRIPLLGTYMPLGNISFTSPRLTSTFSLLP